MTIAVVLFLLLRVDALAGPAANRAADVTPSREQQIKAAFLYNFTKFVEWPAQSFPDPHDPLVIGVLGRSPAASVFTAALTETIQGRVVNGHSVIARRVESADAAVAVHVLFVTSSDQSSFPQLGARIATDPVLTVGESPAFARAGGIIDFVIDGDKVRFSINVAAAERAGLKISAQLLKLATPAHADTPDSAWHLD